jgi:hypothetical protein
MDDTIATGNNQTTGDDNSASMAQDTAVNQDSDTQLHEGSESLETEESGNESEADGSERTDELEEELPFHKNPYVIKMKQELASLREEKAKWSSTNEELNEQSSLESQDQNTDRFSSHPLLKGVEMPQFKEMQVDPATGEVLSEGYASYGEFAKDLVAYIADVFPNLVQNQVSMDEQLTAKQQESFDRSMLQIREDIGSEEAAKEFLNWYKGKSDKGMNLSLDQAYPIFKEDIYKPKGPSNQANKNAASKVARSDNVATGSGSRSIRSTSLSDFIKGAIK